MKQRALWFFGVATFLGIAAATVWLFYFGGFASLLPPESASLPVEAKRRLSRAHRDATILVLGNSTAGEDFRTEWFNRHSPKEQALNLATPSAHIYMIERMLSLAMQEGLRPRKIIVTASPEVLSLRPDFDFLLNDVMLLKTVLTSADLARLWAHTRDAGNYLDFASRVAIRPVLYHAELRDLLLHPSQRFEEAARIRKYLAGIDRNTLLYESSDSFSVCGAGPLADLKEKIRTLEAAHDPVASHYTTLQASYAVRAHLPLAVDGFETQRFRHMLRSLAAVARVYVVPAPYYDPEFEQYTAAYRSRMDETIRQVTTGVTGVTLLPAFRADCSMFADTIHLNVSGGEQFTEYLRARVL
jgi:hypothetical protein